MAEQEVKVQTADELKAELRKEFGDARFSQMNVQIQAAPKEPGFTEKTVGFAKRAAIPTALMSAAALVPGAGPVVGGVRLSTIVAEMGLAALGETINQVAGITEPSKGEIVGAAVTAPIARVGGGAVIEGAKGIGRKLIPGFPVAVVAEATEKTLEFPAALRKQILPGRTSQEMFAEVAKSSPTQIAFPLKNTLKTVAELSAVEDKVFKGIKRAAGGSKLSPMLRGMVEDLGPVRNVKGRIVGQKQIDFETVRINIQEINKAISSAEGRELGALKKIRKSMAEDLDESVKFVSGADSAVIKIYKDAVEAFKKEMSLDTLDVLVQDNARTVQGLGIKLINGAPLLDRFDKVVRDDDLFAKGFSVVERREIRDYFVELAKLPVAGWETGDVVIAGALGGATGSAIAPGFGGGAVGAAAAIEGSKVLRDLAATKLGRRLLLTAFKQKGILDRPTIARIAQAVRSGRERVEDESLFPPGFRELPTQ